MPSSSMGNWLIGRINRLKLRHKLALAILGNIGVVLLVFSLIIDHYQKDRLLATMEQKNLSLARNQASEAVDSLLMRNYLQLDILVSSSQEAILAKYACIVDDRGTVIAHTNKEKLGEHRDLHETHKLMTRDQEQNGLVIREYIVPIAIKGELLGHSILGVDKYKEAGLVARNLSKLRSNLLWVSAALFLLGVVSSSLMSGALTKRIRSLKDRMFQVQKGNLDVAMPEEPCPRCSELLSCKQTQCQAYSSSMPCWTIEGTMHSSYRDCLSCYVYRRASGDEIGELNLAFNQMVTELRSNIEKLEQASLEKSRLERLSMLGQMSAQVAHEIKNPLNAIKGSAHYLKNNFQGAMLHEFLEVIEKESERLSDIVTNFLNFSKPGPPVMQLTDLNQMVRETLRLAQGEARDKGISLNFEADEDLPTLKFDYAKIKQALLNLLVNAIQASPQNSVVVLRTQADNGEVRLSVRDSGPGIDPESLENLFKPFYTTKVRGSGLGLAIAEQNVREHLGRIEVSGQAGAGALFTIVIPWMEQ